MSTKTQFASRKHSCFETRENEQVPKLRCSRGCHSQRKEFASLYFFTYSLQMEKNPFFERIRPIWDFERRTNCSVSDSHSNLSLFLSHSFHFQTMSTKSWDWGPMRNWKPICKKSNIFCFLRCYIYFQRELWMVNILRTYTMCAVCVRNKFRRFGKRFVEWGSLCLRCKIFTEKKSRDWERLSLKRTFVQVRLSSHP